MRLATAKRHLLSAMVASGIKRDEGKPMIDLLVPEFIEAMARVMNFGAKKYGPGNWKLNLEKRRLLAAMYRHALAYHRGELKDKETDISHLAHVGCNAMFLYWYEEVMPRLEVLTKEQIAATARRAKGAGKVHI